MKNKAINRVILILLLILPVLAYSPQTRAVEISQFPQMKPIFPRDILSQAYGIVDLDEEVLSGASEDFSNVRIFDQENREVQRLIRRKFSVPTAKSSATGDVDSKRPVIREYPVSNMTIIQDEERKETLIQFDVNRIPLTQIILEITDLNFSRPAELSRLPGANPPGSSPLICRADLYRITSDDFLKENLVIKPGRFTRTDRLQIKILNHDNQPLNIQNVRVLGEIYEAVFYFKIDDEYRICFGGQGLPAPQYDIYAVLAQKAPDSLTIFESGKAIDNPDFQKVETPEPVVPKKTLLISAIILMVLTLFYLIMTTVRKFDSGQSSGTPR